MNCRPKKKTGEDALRLLKINGIVTPDNRVPDMTTFNEAVSQISEGLLVKGALFEVGPDGVVSLTDIGDRNDTVMNTNATKEGSGAALGSPGLPPIYKPDGFKSSCT
jgi:hypothetical protein